MKRALLILAAFAILLPALVWQSRAMQAELAQPFDRHGAAFTGSDTCRSCHQDHHASWYRTYHRTMTQEASAASVQGAFDGRVVEAWGGRLRPVQRDGHYYFEALAPDDSVQASFQVQRTVGSHRYQQYLALQPGNGQYIRLPLLWHMGEQRWVHMNGVFLYDDRQSYSQHVGTWNQNCIYCHNTGPQPRITNSTELYARAAQGQPVNFLREAHYDSQVAELGIACETCHGPGAEHARRNRNPLRRYALHLGNGDDPTIVNPRKLDARRETYVCAQCHAQRVPVRDDLVETWLTTGPTFRAGDELAQHVRWITHEEPGPANNPDLYKLRFWSDGTPRLSAYEFQGLSQSKCWRGGKLSCMNCHEAHGGDVHGMMRDDGRSNAPCTACHGEIAQNVRAHTHHADDSSGSLCINCHMPPMVYGVMEIHRSHRIANPDPTAEHAAERPGACAGCHLDRDAGWLEASVAAWKANAPVPAASGNLAENTRQLLGGDPVQRAVAAKLAGRRDSALTPALRQAQIPALLLAMEDGYPAVRRFAFNSLRAIASETGIGTSAEGAAFDFTGSRPQRAAALAALRTDWERYRAQHGVTVPELSGDQLASLRQQAAQTAAINIGE